MQWRLLPVWTLETRQRTVSRLQQCATTVDRGDTWQGRALKRKKGSKERKKQPREITKERGKKGKLMKVGGGIRKERERARVFKHERMRRLKPE